MKAIKIGLMIVGIVLGSHGWTTSTKMIQTNRYSHDTLTPTPEQRQLLSVIVHTEFPNTIQKVGDAIDYLLVPNGYRLTMPDPPTSFHYVLLNQRLPAIHRELGPMRLRTALEILAGDSYEWVVNPVKRTIEFRLKTRYQDTLTEIDAMQSKQSWEAHVNRQSSEKTTIDCDPQNRITDYGPIRRGETLLGIANKLHFPGLSAEQVMISLLEHNPQAFPTHNINQLLEQAMLKVPGQAQLSQISPEDARIQVQEYYQQWQSVQNNVKED